MPAISIIIPAYNAENTIQNAIDSVLEQSFKDWELILIDDGSTDTTASIANQYSKKDCRITLINQVNKGRSVARNVGISYAKGIWLSFLDADDMLPPTSLQTLYDNVNNNTDLICGGYSPSNVKLKTPFYVKSWTGRQFANLVLSPANEKELALSDNYFNGLFERTVWGKLYRKKLITDNNIDFIKGLKFGEDALFNIAFGLRANEIKTINFESYYYNNTTPSTTRYKRIPKDQAEYLFKFAQCAHEYLKSLQEAYTIKDADIYNFIANEFMELFHRVIKYSANITSAEKLINEYISLEIINQSLPYIKKPTPLNNFAHKQYAKLIQSHHIKQAIHLERLIHLIDILQLKIRR